MSNDRDAAGAKGRTVGGRYRLLERIGSGGMGTVWRAHDELVDREVAVKEPRLPGEPGDESHRRAAHRLYREARAAARVDHPSAVSIHDVVAEEADGEGADPVVGAAGLDVLPWIVMELVRGESLQELLRRGPLAPPEAARIGLAVLGALRAAHAVGIVHRDVKPANVLLGAHGRVVLTDFGIAHVQGEDPLTATGEFVGSLEFVAPERMSGRIAGPPSDLWSLGVLLYAAVEGWSPFRRTSLESTLAAILTANAPEPQRAGALGPLLTRLLVKDPALRPDAEQAEAVLRAVADGTQPVPEAAGDVPAADAWPAPEASTESGPAAQESRALREFAEDIRTRRLATRPATPGADGVPEGVGGREADRIPAAVRTPSNDDTPNRPGTTVEPPPPPPPTGPEAPASPPRRSLHRRPLPLALLGGVLVGTVWFGSAFVLDSDDGADTRNTAAHSPSSGKPGPGTTSAPSAAGWTAHPEQAMRATLSLPTAYTEFARQGNDTVQPRMVEYAAGSVQVRFVQYDSSPGGDLMSQAKQHARTWTYFDEHTTQYTVTSLRGRDAVQSDTVYGDQDARHRVLEFFVRTEDGRQYELRVEMPKGSAEEKQGAALFKAARDRLVILPG
ncbi:serine/threonine-protein kinase [Streptomyces longwoodensis]|uniref:serine/threonine-protein kinase n=1 Tax=Streptomyces longwoodensis TaxID=68231 RepID=UPI0030DF5126|nr:serine/threonine protein kinase [Streptomyces longwoodensis]